MVITIFLKSEGGIPDAKRLRASTGLFGHFPLFGAHRGSGKVMLDRWVLAYLLGQSFTA
jgi:hypothetical protein